MRHQVNNWVATGHCCFEATAADATTVETARSDIEKIAAACQDLVKASENIIEIVADLGYDRMGSYREDLDAVRKAQAAVETILNDARR